MHSIKVRIALITHWHYRYSKINKLTELYRIRCNNRFIRSVYRRRGGTFENYISLNVTRRPV